jgi:hypothetical protein
MCFLFDTSIKALPLVTATPCASVTVIELVAGSSPLSKSITISFCDVETTEPTPGS